MKKIFLVSFLLITISSFGQFFRSNAIGQPIEKIAPIRFEEFPYVLERIESNILVEKLYKDGTLQWTMEYRDSGNQKIVLKRDNNEKLLTREVYNSLDRLVERNEYISEDKEKFFEYFYDSLGRVSRIRESFEETIQETLYQYQGNYLKKISLLKNNEVIQEARYFYAPDGALQIDKQVVKGKLFYFQNKQVGITGILQTNREGLIQKEEKILYDEEGSLFEKKIWFEGDETHLEKYDQGNLISLEKKIKDQIISFHRFFYVDDNLVRERIDFPDRREDYFWEYSEEGDLEYSAFKINLVFQWEKFYSKDLLTKEVWYKDGYKYLEKTYNDENE